MENSPAAWTGALLDCCSGDEERVNLAGIQTNSAGQLGQQREVAAKLRRVVPVDPRTRPLRLWEGVDGALNSSEQPGVQQSPKCLAARHNERDSGGGAPCIEYTGGSFNEAHVRFSM